MDWYRVKIGDTGLCRRITIVKNDLAGRVQAYYLVKCLLETPYSHVINKIVEWRIFVDTTAARYLRIKVSGIIPNFRGGVGLQV